MCDFQSTSIKVLFTLDEGPKKPLCIVPTSFSSSFLTTLWFRVVSVAGVTHQRLCFKQSFVLLWKWSTTLSSAIKRVVVSLSCKEESCVTEVACVLLGFRCCYACSDGSVRRTCHLPPLPVQAAFLLLVPAPQTWPRVSATFLHSLSCLPD